jgi:DNA-binding NarL/FixJ family response regulator
MVRMNAASANTVFIVDDAPFMRERLRELVDELPDAEVIGDAATPAAAIAGILATKPACVLLDYQLREGTGVDVLRAVHAKTASTIYVVLTNHPEPQYRRACMAAGADYFFDKSTEFDRIADVIREIRQPSN